MNQVRVALRGDHLIRAGLTRYLQFRPGLRIIPEPETADADVLVTAAYRLTAAHLADLRRHAPEARTPAVLIVDEITEKEVLLAVSCHVTSILPLSTVTAGELFDAIRAARAGGGMMPPELTGLILKHLRGLIHDAFTQHGLNTSLLTTREIDVIRLVADGMDTKEIAATLNCTTRTVKTLLEAAGRRLNLRSRSHAVAYAIRTGAL